MAEEFVDYVGSAEIHDAIIQRVETDHDTVTVYLKAYEGRQFAVRFHGVSSYAAQNAEGMMLYALSETSGVIPLRKFNFLNWDEEDSARLEIVAEGLLMLDTASDFAQN